VQARQSLAGRIDRVGEDTFPYPIIAIPRSSRGIATRWPLPVGCPLARARWPPDRRIAQTKRTAWAGSVL